MNQKINPQKNHPMTYLEALQKAHSIFGLENEKPSEQPTKNDTIHQENAIEVTFLTQPNKQ